MLHITQSYERDNFQDFLRNDFLTDNFTPCEEEIFFDFKNIKQGYKLGEDKTLDLDVFEFETISEFDPRVTLTREVAKLMKKYGTCPNALVAFYNSNKNTWRLSLITTDYINENGKIKTEYSNPRRFSFVLGEHCKAHTPEQMLISKGQVQDVLDLHSRFDIEVVTKEFYNKLFEWYSFAIKKVTYPVGSTENISEIKQSNKNNELNLIRLITRLIFVWFIKQKNLVPDWIFDKNKIANILKNFSPEKGSNYYNAILQNLFFATLNKKIEDREFATDERRKYNSQFGVKNYFRDNQKESFFKISHDEVLKLFYSVPFLNGGLFECLDKLKDDKAKTKNIQEFTDGFSREPKWRAFVPNELFFSENSEHEGLIVLLNRYNFTVEENTPTDVQVALDPELLGKVFENLLGTYNPETSETARKDSGSFYTPREIVNYMVDESLKAVLSSKCSVDGEVTSDKFSVTDEIIKERCQIISTGKSYDKNKELQRFNNLAKIDSASRESLCAGKETSKRGTICAELANQASGNFDSVEYSGRARAKLKKTIPQFSVDSEGLESGTRNAIIHMQATKNAFGRGYKSDSGNPCGIRKNDKCANEEASVDKLGKDSVTCHLSLVTKLDELFNDQCDNPFTLSESKQVANAIKSLKILDPAVGSGAFPMGVLLRMVHLLQKLGAISQNGLYDLKLSLLENCIFGVDIQPIAVQICKLRFFISIICEQEKSNDASKNYGIRPLPNLESKFVAANTLIGLAKEKEQVDLFGNEIAIDKIKTDLAKNRHKDFSAKTSEEKWKLREEYKELRQKLAGEYGSESAKQLNAWDPYDQNASSSWFSSEWMFNVKADCDNGRQKRAFSTGCGFDVVLGNPPYISAPRQIATTELAKQREILSKSDDYNTLYQKWDLYIAFIERGIKLCTPGGVVAMIVPLPLTNQVYGKKMREMLTSDYDLYKIVDLSGTKVFEKATVTNCIPFIIKQKSPSQSVQIVKASVSSTDTLQLNNTFSRTYDALAPDAKTAVWNLSESERTSARHADMHTLGDFCFISYGLRPNSDDKTAKGEFKKADLISDTEDEIHCREYVEGKDIDNYILKRIRYFEWNTERSPNKLVVPTFRKFYKYPKLMFNRLGNLHVYYDTKALIHNDSIIGAVLWKDLKDIDNINITMSIKKFCHFYQEQKEPGMSDYQKKKLVKKVRAQMETLSESVNLLYLLAVLNSKYAQVLLNNIRGTDYHIYPNHIRNLPIPLATPEQQKTLADLAQKILDAKAAVIANTKCEAISSSSQKANEIASALPRNDGDAKASEIATKSATSRNDGDANTSEAEKQIDAIVYRLYGLTAEEIKVIENLL